jgi:hypothetical protein
MTEHLPFCTPPTQTKKTPIHPQKKDMYLDRITRPAPYKIALQLAHLKKESCYSWMNIIWDVNNTLGHFVVKTMSCELK